MKEKLVTLGSGLAGLTAAIYAARANLNPLVIAGTSWGGQLMITTDVDNYPGFPEGIQGPELMENVQKQAERFKVRIINDDATDADLTKKPYKITINNDVINTETIIIATGASAKWLNIPSEQKLIGKGVSACATCDGFFFKNKIVVVVGGGDTAMEEAKFLTKFAKEVVVIHRQHKLRASKIMQEQAFNNSKIRFIWNTVVNNVIGNDKVEGIEIKNIQDNNQTVLKCDGLFIAIGHKPNTDIFINKIKMNKNGYIIKQENSNTNVPGVFVAGDVNDIRYKQAITAASDGCKAAIDAEKYLEDL